MTPYFTAAVQSVFTGMITFAAAALSAHGVTADVTSITMLALVISYAATLAIAALRNYLIRTTLGETVTTSSVPEPADVLAENPWHDPDLVENARSFISEEQHREANRDFWRRSGRGKASFRDAHWPIVNYIQKG